MLTAYMLVRPRGHPSRPCPPPGAPEEEARQGLGVAPRAIWVHVRGHRTPELLGVLAAQFLRSRRGWSPARAPNLAHHEDTIAREALQPSKYYRSTPQTARMCVTITPRSSKLLLRRKSQGMKPRNLLSAISVAKGHKLRSPSLPQRRLP